MKKFKTPLVHCVAFVIAVCVFAGCEEPASSPATTPQVKQPSAQVERDVAAVEPTAAETSKSTESNSNWPHVDAKAVPAGALASDSDKLDSQLEKNVTIRGTIERVDLTRDGRNLTGYFSSDDDGLLLWIDARTKERLDKVFAGGVALAIEGREVVVKAKLEEYGGKSERLQGRKQLYVGQRGSVELVSIDGKIPPAKSFRPYDPRFDQPPAPLAEAPAKVTPLGTPVPKGALRIIEWNTQSGQSAPATISTQLEKFKATDLLALSEVDPLAFDMYLEAAEAIDARTFADLRSESGDEDRLQVIYDAARFDVLEHREPTELAGIVVNDGRHRSPFIVRFRDKESKREFLLVVVHQARGDEELRNKQATALREWTRDQDTAVIICGDFNFDFHWDVEKGNASFDELVRDNILKWVRPKLMVESNWSDVNRDGRNDYPKSLIEGFLVAGPATEWQGESRVIVREGDYPDDNNTSDHRPLELVITPK